jgi:putative beta-lysine N-acetyltransferase
MYDRIDRLGDTVFQHGPYNDRVYVMRTVPADLEELLPYLENLAGRRRYGKVIAKVPTSCREAFLGWGAREEASLPGYHGDQDAHFVARYFDPDRAEERKPEVVAENLTIARTKAAEAPSAQGDGWDHEVAEAGADDAEEMGNVYQQVFPTYPFPIFDPAYLRQAMQNDVAFFKLCRDGHIGALASAEMDLDAGAVEMTDFATLPELRGQGAAQSLLLAMEAAMRERGLRLGFTIARAFSTGMNVTFAKCGYEYGGTLVNNTNIAGRIESMNIWSRPLA